MTAQLFDPGLQPERTILAWRRTILSFAIASVVVARFAYDPMWLTTAGFGIAISATGWICIERRQRTSIRSLLAGNIARPAGVAITIAAIATLCLGIAGGIWLILGTGN
ncbi:DUF202 domain-containing protein [Herbiconiux sp. VKM Ac-1786]|uniref:DUF202 domain-containing protein n=1 Tax=Herbiconiux sp. VKM Ac-1786 TaxID=2783824 RepID=UPI00188BFBBE|nr:DUF202 domain-containing protein [Herbiconiux sp. VKM Ac-1786]MBF4571919.1 DUF202 domain-containing protein [Herbiconiux sp. VKM Ac-1786]